MHVFVHFECKFGHLKSTVDRKRPNVNYMTYVCMCVCMCVYVCAHACECVYTHASMIGKCGYTHAIVNVWRSLDKFRSWFYVSYLVSDRVSLLFFCCVSPQASRYSAGSINPALGDSYRHQLYRSSFTWVVGIWTQIILHVHQPFLFTVPSL